eukprot:c21343_g1_i1.p1 GENE.c21343_g1_i1~~c21343_g1_i1.p1  ORF type:complete len:155 (-),score=27.96 c21343_g1_i1:54-518(-)
MGYWAVIALLVIATCNAVPTEPQSTALEANAHVANSDQGVLDSLKKWVQHTIFGQPPEYEHTDEVSAEHRLLRTNAYTHDENGQPTKAENSQETSSAVEMPSTATAPVQAAPNVGSAPETPAAPQAQPPSPKVGLLGSTMLLVSQMTDVTNMIM